MSNLELSLACGHYEITRALIDGTVRPDGIDLTVLSHDKERIYTIGRRDEVDLCEFNVMEFFRQAGLGHPILALPIFTHRRFRHGSIYINTEAGITSPADLSGRAVVIGGYRAAATIWIRGILQDEYGVALGDVDWIDVFGILGRLPEGQAEPFESTTARLEADKVLLSGEAAAMISPYIPRAFLDGDPRVQRLFPDTRAVEAEYFARTGIFPIMHAITVRRSIIEEHPWVPESVTAAFTEAKRVALERLRNPRVLPLAFWQYALEEQNETMGEDPWEYGLTKGNRTALDAALRYATAQEICRPGLHIDELFLDVQNTSLTPAEFI